MIKRLGIYIFLFLTIAPVINGQNINVTSAFDSSRIYIGDQISFTITIDQPPGIILTIPVLKDTLCKNIEILSGPLIDSSSNQDGSLRIIEKYIVTSFDSGFYQIPPVFAEMKNQEGLKRFYSDYSRLVVQRIEIAPADTTAKIFDIIKPYRAPVTIGEVLPWILVVALAAIIVWAAVRFLRKLKKSDKSKEIVINPDPAHVIAFRELEKLRKEQLWQKGEIKHYHTRLTEILRRYLENRFRVFSLELTTYETLGALVKTGFKKDVSYNQLKTVLTGADLVKFAKYNPEPSENEMHFQNSWDFVTETKETEVIDGGVDFKEKVGEGKK